MLLLVLSLLCSCRRFPGVGVVVIVPMCMAMTAVMVIFAPTMIDIGTATGC